MTVGLKEKQEWELTDNYFVKWFMLVSKAEDVHTLHPQFHLKIYLQNSSTCVQEAIQYTCLTTRLTTTLKFPKVKGMGKLSYKQQNIIKVKSIK